MSLDDMISALENVRTKLNEEGVITKDVTVTLCSGEYGCGGVTVSKYDSDNFTGKVFEVDIS